MNIHYLLYGHGGSYNHGAEAIVRATINSLRRTSPNCRITLSTHFAKQDKQFNIPADEFIERSTSGNTNAEIYAPTIERITSNSVCFHVGGDNYCYLNWQRWAEIHYAALERGAKSVLWSCSIDPDLIDDEMLNALQTHHLITARESITYNALIERGLENVVKVSDIAFTLEPEPVNFKFNNYVVINASPLVMKKNAELKSAYQKLIDYILENTPLNIALVPHVVQPVDNDYDALSSFNAHEPNRVKLAPDNLRAGQYKTIISSAEFCVAARTHAAIAAYSSCVPTLAVSYSAKSIGIAKDLGMAEFVVNAEHLENGLELVEAFIKLYSCKSEINEQLKRQMPKYSTNAFATFELMLPHM